MTDVPILTSLRHAPGNPLTAQQRDSLRRRAWLEHGVAVLEPKEIADDWTRQAVTNLMIQRYGRRLPKR